MLTKSSAVSESSSTRRARQVKRPRGDEQNVVGFDRPVAGVDCRAFDQRQQVALHTLARDVAADVLACGDFVNFIQKDDAVLFDVVDGNRAQVVFVDALGGLFFDDELEGFLDLEFARFGFVACQIGEHAAQLLGHVFHTGGTHDFHLRDGQG